MARPAGELADSRSADVTARDLWRVLEPFHQLAYRTEEATERMSALGLDRPDLQYFGGRLSALGPISMPLAVAVLFGFEPEYVGRAVPEVWSKASPESIVSARVASVDATFRRVLGDEVGAPAVVAAAALARRAVGSCDLAGRPMAAAHFALPWPEPAHLQLWHACTILREHRGDAHWAVTSAMGLDAVECHVLHAADGYMPHEVLQRVTGWSDEAWEAALGRLVARGLVSDRSRTTEEGARFKAELERRTDRLASHPYAALTEVEQVALRDAVSPLVARLLDAGVAAIWKQREVLWREPPAEIAGSAER